MRQHSIRKSCVPCKTLIIGVLVLTALLYGEGPTFGLSAPALDTPPTDYQRIGTCMPGVGHPYVHTKQQFKKPILIYADSKLSAVAYLMTEQDVLEGQAVTVLTEFGGLPIDALSFGYTPNNPYVDPPVRGPYYLLWIRLQDRLLTGFIC